MRRFSAFAVLTRLMWIWRLLQLGTFQASPSRRVRLVSCMLEALGRGWLDPRSSVWAFNGKLGRLIPLIRRWHSVEKQRLPLVLIQSASGLKASETLRSFSAQPAMSWARSAQSKS